MQPRRDILIYLSKDIHLNFIDLVWTIHCRIIERCATIAQCHEILKKYSPSYIYFLHLVLQESIDYDFSLLVNLHIYERELVLNILLL